MPALASALAGDMPQQAVRALMQAIGNCNQPVSQRGGVNAQDTRRLPNGIAESRTWNSYEYNDILPYAGQDPLAGRPGSSMVLPNLPGHSNGDWNTSNYFSSFSFPTNNEFNSNNLFRNVTNHFGGDSFFESVTVNNISFGGGRAGRDGRDGAAGTAGRDGLTGAAGQRGADGAIIFLGGVGTPIPFVPISYVTNVKTTINFTRAKLKEISLDIPVFNPETCENEEQTFTAAIEVEQVDAGNPAAPGTLVVTGGFLINQVETAIAKTLL